MRCGRHSRRGSRCAKRRGTIVWSSAAIRSTGCAAGSCRGRRRRAALRDARGRCTAVRPRQACGARSAVSWPALTVPTHYLPSQVIHRFGGEPIIAGDNWFADLDDDRLPDVAIGRLPADSVRDLRVMVSKIVAYERGPAPGAWQRRINLVAGLGGFGAFADAAIEASAKRLLIAGIPAAFATTVTYGSWRSPYCPDPRQFHAATVERLDEGCLFWVYMGHGRTRAVDRVRTPDGQHHIFDTNDCARLRCGERSPIALLLCCSAGGFDQPEDCLAEELLRAEQGPVAGAGGLARDDALCDERAGGRDAADFLSGRLRRRWASLLKEAKRAMMLRPRDDAQSKAVDALAQVLNPASNDLAVERAEHLDLFNLIGDPLLKLRMPATATVDAPLPSQPGRDNRGDRHQPRRWHGRDRARRAPRPADVSTAPARRLRKHAGRPRGISRYLLSRQQHTARG